MIHLDPHDRRTPVPRRRRTAVGAALVAFIALGTLAETAPAQSAGQARAAHPGTPAADTVLNVPGHYPTVRAPRWTPCRPGTPGGSLANDFDEAAHELKGEQTLAMKTTGDRIVSDAPAGTFHLGRPWHPGGEPDAIAQG